MILFMFLQCFLLLFSSSSSSTKKRVNIKSSKETNWVSWPSDEQDKLAMTKTIALLKKSELQIVTWTGDIPILKYFWYSIELFAPFFRGVTIIYEERDEENLKTSFPLDSFPMPVCKRVVKDSSHLRLKSHEDTNSSLKSYCKDPQTSHDGMHRYGYLQQQLYVLYSDTFSCYNDVDYIINIDSDMIFFNFEYLAGALFNSKGNIEYTANLHKYSNFNKAMINSLLGIKNNEYQFMERAPFVFHKNVFASMRQEIMNNNKNYNNFVDLIQQLYINNRICNSVEAYNKFGIMVNIDLIIAYVYYYKQNSTDVTFVHETTKKKQGTWGYGHLIIEKNKNRQNQDSQSYAKSFSEKINQFIGCNNWYCYSKENLSKLKNNIYNISIIP